MIDQEPVNPPLRLLASFQQLVGVAPSLMLAVPAREMWVLVAPADSQHADEQRYTIITPDLDNQTAFDVRGARLRQTYLNRPLPRWARYIALALVAMTDDGIRVPPAQLFIAGDEPQGPRYEYTLGMAMATYGYHHHGRVATEPALVDLLEKATRRYG